jgi:phenylalanyl-tRNA synthetase alpha chain
MPAIHIFAPMQSLQEQIKTYEQDINSFTPSDAKELEEYRIKYLGTKGIVKQIFGEMKNVPAEQKKEAGQVLNAFKQLAEGRY